MRQHKHNKRTSKLVDEVQVLIMDGVNTDGIGFVATPLDDETLEDAVPLAVATSEPPSAWSGNGNGDTDWLKLCTRDGAADDDECCASAMRIGLCGGA